METDPNGKDPHSPGSKLDEGKPSLYRGVIRYFPRALERVAEVSAFGANKYTWGGWRSVPDGCSRYKDAAIRHSVKEEYEGEYDSDSGLLHAAHLAWNALASLELQLDELETQQAYPDTRSEKEEEKILNLILDAYTLRQNDAMETNPENGKEEESKEPHGGDTLFWGIRTEGC